MQKSVLAPLQPVGPKPETPTTSALLAEELERLRIEEQQEHDRRQQEELARQRELARFD